MLSRCVCTVSAAGEAVVVLPIAALPPISIAILPAILLEEGVSAGKSGFRAWSRLPIGAGIGLLFER